MKRKTGIQYVKEYNRKVTKTKKPYTYIQIEEDMYKELTAAERGQITKLLKKFDLRSERQVKGSSVSINTRNLLQLLEKFSNKRIEEYTEATNVSKFYSAGHEVPVENQMMDQPVLTTHIDVKKLNEREIIRKAKSFQAHFAKDFYRGQLIKMQDNYVTALAEQSIEVLGHDREGIIKYLKGMNPYEFYRIYKANLDMRVIFENSPKTHRKAEIEFPMTDPVDTINAIAVASGYAELLMKETAEDMKEQGYHKSKINKLLSMDKSSFWNLYIEDALNIYIENL